MSDNEDLQSVLDELQKVLSGLTKEDKEQKVTPPAPPEIKPAEIPAAKEQPLPPEVPLKEQEIQETAEKVEETELRELIPEDTTPVSKTQKPAQVPQAAKPPEPVEIDEKKEEIDEEIPENATVLDYAIFYPTTNSESSETFRKNLLNVVKKTSKKPFYFRRVMRGAIDIASVIWEDLIKKCVGNKVQAVFLIHTDKFDSYELKNKFTDLGIFFQSIPVSQLERRITYVDMVIELMLAKKED